MHRTALTALAALLAPALLTACLADKAAPPAPIDSAACDTVGVTYTGRISQIVNTNCALPECHNQADYASFTGIPLYDYRTVKEQTLGGTVLCSILREAGCEPMPYEKDPLPACEIAQLQAWVRLGCPE